MLRSLALVALLCSACVPPAMLPDRHRALELARGTEADVLCVQPNGYQDICKLKLPPGTVILILHESPRASR